MQAPVWTDFLSCSICTNKFNPTDTCPVSLNCGHTLCTRCLSKLKTRTCPYDKMAIGPEVESHPPNVALLQLLGHQVELPLDNSYVTGLSAADQKHYHSALLAVGELALVLKPLAEHGTTAAMGHLTKPMLKKLVTVVNCQIVEGEGRMRALRAARSIADRTVTELLVMHQNQQQVSTLLWTAVRNRGCQFLGPVMQEEALKLILRVLESGNSLSRKNIVLFVVQRLSVDFPQASKTSIGHVVQLLYRASCFNVEKRDDDSSLMQLKEEFRVYESLRREHDSQIIRMALEAGLRISPEQWSTLLYGDHKHKSDMQSIIDKLTAQGAVSSGLSELIVAIGRSQDPYQLSEKVLPHLETILKLQVDKDCEVFGWEEFSSVLTALLATLQGFSAYMQIQSGRFKTGMCPYLSKPGGCPKGDSCTYAHTEEERDKFRNLVRPTSKPMNKPRSGEQFPKNGPLSRAGGGSGSRSSRYSGDLGPSLSLDTSTPLSSLGSLVGGGGGMHSSSGESGSPEVSYNALLHGGGEGCSYRLSRHSGPITAPVMPSHRQELNVATVTRGVATANQVYLGPTDNNAMSSYLPVPTPGPVGVATPGPVGGAGGVDYHSTARLGTAVTYPVVPTTQQFDLDILKLQHEVVKQAVESATYPKDVSLSSVGPTYGEWMSSNPGSQSSYSTSLSQQPSLPSSYECSPRVATDIQSAAIAAALSQQQSGQSYSPEQLLASMRDLRLSQTGLEYSMPHSSVDLPPTQSSTTPCSAMTTPSASTLPAVSAQASNLSTSAVHPRTSGACMGADLSSGMSGQTPCTVSNRATMASGTDSSNVEGGADTGTNKDLEAEIRLLREQLRERNQTIQQQQAQLQGVVRPSAPPTANVQGARYPVSQQQVYSNVPVPSNVGVQVVTGEDPSSLTYASHYPSQHTQQHAQPTQFTSQQIQEALAVIMGAKGGATGVGSNIPTASSNYYATVASTYPAAPQRWSGQQATPPSMGVYSGPHSMPVASNLTPPGTGYILSLPGANSMPVNASLPQQPQAVNPALIAAANAPPLSSRLHSSEHPDDSMLAAYIQMMEQNKAAAGGPASYQQAQPHPSVYTPTQNQYYYQQ